MTGLKFKIMDFISHVSAKRVCQLPVIPAVEGKLKQGTSSACVHIHTNMNAHIQNTHTNTHEQKIGKIL